MNTRLTSLLVVVCALPALAQECERAAALEAYRSEMLGTSTTTEELAWTGDANDCDAGKHSDLARQHALRRVNYFRRMVGLGPVTVDEAFSAKAQKAAVMMHGARRLDHYPDSTYACYTEDGRVAAGKSNLYFGSWGAHAVAGYVKDPGANNTAVGHRRWILHPPKERIGLGFTDRADAMWVIGGKGDRPATPEGVAWPPAGYVPAPLIYPRWSFSQHKADFHQAVVTMTGPDGAPIELTQNEVADGFGDNTIVWEPVPGAVDTRATVDASYAVTISNVVEGGESKTYSYTVIAVTPEVAGCGEAPVSSLDRAAGDRSRLAYRAAAGELVLSDAVGRFDLRVVDELGREVHRGEIAVDEAMPVSSLPTGIYFATLTRVDGSAVQHVVRFSSAG